MRARARWGEGASDKQTPFTNVSWEQLLSAAVTSAPHWEAGFNSWLLSGLQRSDHAASGRGGARGRWPAVTVPVLGIQRPLLGSLH